MAEIIRIVELATIGIIFFFGVLCNCVVIRSICLVRRTRGTVSYNIKNECVNLLVMNLAITDLLTLIVSIPMDVVPEHISWPYGTFICKFISPIQDICLTASTLTFSAIAVERYLVSKGVHHKGARNAKLVRMQHIYVYSKTIRAIRSSKAICKAPSSFGRGQLNC